MTEPTAGGPLPPFLVHLAGEPGPDHVQRCVPCGAELTDNRPWYEGRIAIPVGQPDNVPCWWPVGALIATDKTSESRCASMTYTVESGRALDVDEALCNGTVTAEPSR